MLKTYGALFPDIKFCPTGGITAETSREYLALENVFAVGGSWFQNDFKNS
jgi:2-dehydro-3-deoxyphosphogluconate aldolase/(4S)-4-hydroxy-2-oxoglutarate aldolase